MNLIPIDKSFQNLFDEWFSKDILGQKEMSIYRDLGFWMTLLEPSCRWGWVAYELDNPIGFLDLEQVDNCGSFSFYIAPELRGQGKSKLIVEALIEEATKRKINIIQAGVEESNIASQKSLSSAGFIETGRDGDGYRIFSLNISK